MSTQTAAAPASEMKPTVVITPEHIAFFHENGFLAIDRIMPDSEVSWMRNIYDRLFAEKAGRNEGNQFDLGGSDEEGKEAALPQILSPAKYAPELQNGQFRVNALFIAQQLLGDDAKPTGDHAIFKPAGMGPPTPWHQDEAYWNPDLEYGSLSIWIPLQEATVENGCLWFVPGSQNGEILPHHSIGHDVRVHGLELDEDATDTSTAVACPLPAGGATIHRNRTLHYAGPNTSAIPRRAFIAGFGLPNQPRIGTARRFPWNEIKQTARDARQKAAQEKGQDEIKEPGV